MSTERRLLQRLAGEERGEEEPVRLQRAPELDERARKVVGPVERRKRDHRIEARGRDRQEVGLGDEPHRPRGAHQRLRRIHVDEMSDLPASAQRGGEQSSPRAHHERRPEGAPHLVETLDELFGDFGEEEVVALGAGAMGAQRAAIEHHDRR